jgi:aryl-alcohol dehydrogenase-like predicted oxidoreductase
LDAIDGSLRRLGTDYVDIYQLHFDGRTLYRGAGADRSA